MKCPMIITLPSTFRFISIVGDARQISKPPSSSHNQHCLSMVVVGHATFDHYPCCMKFLQQATWSSTLGWVSHIWYDPFLQSCGLIGSLTTTALALSTIVLVHQRQAIYSCVIASMVHFPWASSLPFTLATQSIITKAMHIDLHHLRHDTISCLYIMNSFIPLVEHYQHKQTISLSWL